jgi:hypothetical protein
MQSDGASFENFADTNFDYDLGLSPRVWLEYRRGTDIGMRGRFWYFDQAADPASASPPANGFGLITHPAFGAVDISTGIPTDRFTADSGLKAYYGDLEMTKRGSFDSWDLTASAGLRYGSIEQRYAGRLWNGTGTLAGSLDFEHRLDGIGPLWPSRRAVLWVHISSYLPTPVDRCCSAGTRPRLRAARIWTC